MSRSTRAGVGGVAVFVLLLMAAVSALVAVVASGQAREEDGSWVQSEPPGELFTDPVTVRAEVLDVDGSGEGWASADVAVDTGAGRKVTFVDLGEQTDTSPPLPAVGDMIEVVYERGQPDYVVWANDPMLTGEGLDDVVEPPDEEDRQQAARTLVRRTGGLAVGCLVVALLVGGATAVLIVRAPPEPARIPVRIDESAERRDLSL